MTHLKATDKNLTFCWPYIMV